MMPSAPLPRLLHPAAWWIWAICLAYAAMRTTNLLLLCEIAVVSGLVVRARRGHAPWARSYGLLLGLGVATVVVTVVLQTVIGVRTPGHVLFRLPSLALPSWLNGLTLGGPVTGEALLNSLSAGLRLAVLITCFGAANALAHPARLLRILPAALYQVGVASVVALTFIPQLAESVSRIRAAQRLRGRPTSGLRAVGTVAVPVIEEALERAIALAASMDSRGYGRRTDRSVARRRVSAVALLAGLLGAVVGTYQVIGGSTGGHALGVALLIGGPALALGGALLAGTGAHRTRYRPDPWRGPEWLVVGCGAAVAVAYQLRVHDSTAAGVPYAWPALAVVPFVVTLLAALPAVVTPELPAAVTA
jgi:energy-coupling factor transport system permease protein